MLIGLTGAAGSGKGSVASVLVQRHGFAEIAFADPLYAAVSAFVQIPVSLLKDRKVKEEPIAWVGKSPRELLQLLGTEFGRQMVKESLWVDNGLRRASTLLRYGESVVISDVRFDNEAEAILSAGGVVWEVSRDGDTCLAGSTAAHDSEVGVRRDLIDLSVDNNGTLEDLAAEVDAALAVATGAYNGGSTHGLRA